MRLPPLPPVQEREVAVVSHSAFLHHLFSFGCPREESPLVDSRLTSRLRSESAGAPSSMPPDHAERVAMMEPLLRFHSQPLHRLLRSPFDFCEIKSAALLPEGRQ